MVVLLAEALHHLLLHLSTPQPFPILHNQLEKFIELFDTFYRPPAVLLVGTTIGVDVNRELIDCTWAKDSSSLTEELESKPNIILLLTDDQDVDPGSLEKMANLKNLLMKRGTTFRNAFVHTPICCPSRMSILSGRYLHNIHPGRVNNSATGGCDAESWRSDAELFSFSMLAKDAGYVTSYAGKYLSGAGSKTKGMPGCPDCWRVPPGYDKYLTQLTNALYYNYSEVSSDNGGNDASMMWHGDDYYEDYFPGTS
jgi:hypothetical protein